MSYGPKALTDRRERPGYGLRDGVTKRLRDCETMRQCEGGEFRMNRRFLSLNLVTRYGSLVTLSETGNRKPEETKHPVKSL